MSEALQQFFEANLPVTGLAAWGARLADERLLCRSCNDWYSLGQIEQLLGSLIESAHVLDAQGIQPVRLCWVFENVRLHLVVRREGVCLALFMENRPELANGEAERVLEAFHELPRAW